MRTTISTLLTLAGLCLVPIANAWGQSADGLSRAGCPHQIARFARVGYGSRYVASYVGGGAPASKGECRQTDEGTFGVDYQPILPGFRRATSLNWWHGRRAQGRVSMSRMPRSPLTVKLSIEPAFARAADHVACVKSSKRTAIDSPRTTRNPATPTMVRSEDSTHPTGLTKGFESDKLVSSTNLQSLSFRFKYIGEHSVALTLFDQPSWSRRVSQLIVTAYPLPRC